MKQIPAVLLPAFSESLVRAAVPPAAHVHYRKWLMYYLDFCLKYRHPPRDPDSLQDFLQKLASKNQSGAQQEQAVHSISIYYETV